jgi:ribosomal protein S18 acetylase RimI-like enzyme
LLAAAERAVAEAGVSNITLNVFGGNEEALNLYASSGYVTVTSEMRKSLR